MDSSFGRLRISTMHGIVEDAVGSGTRFQSDKTRRLYAWWLGAGRGLGPPRRSDFDITEHRDLVANVFLVQVLPGTGFRFKVQGETVIDLLGTNNTGRVVMPREGSGDYGHALAEYYQAIVDGRACRLCTGDLDHRNRKHIRFESIDCPLLGDDRVAVVAILGVLAQIR